MADEAAGVTDAGTFGSGANEGILGGDFLLSSQFGRYLPVESAPFMGSVSIGDVWSMTGADPTYAADSGESGPSWIIPLRMLVPMRSIFVIPGSIVVPNCVLKSVQAESKSASAPAADFEYMSCTSAAPFAPLARL